MIPIGDVSRRPLHFPIITALIIGANALVYALELAGGERFIYDWSLIPAEIVAGRNWLTMLTSLFMHAGWTHILGNMLFLWVFGPEIEDVMGPVRYLTFYFLSGLVAAFAQIVADPTSPVPTLGASGAVAGVMGAFLITYPRDQIRAILLIFYFIRIALIPAVVLVGFWFLLQLFSEVGALAATQTGGVAYMAHIGGFIFGMVTARLFETRRRRAAQGLEE